MLRVARHAGHWVAALTAVALVLVALNVRPAPAITTPADDPSASPHFSPTASTKPVAQQVAYMPMSDVITPVPRPPGTASPDPTPTPPPSVSTPSPTATPPPPVPTPSPLPSGPTPVPVADPNPATYTTSEISGSFGQSLTLEGTTVMLRRSTTPADSQCLPLFAGDAFEMTIHYTTWFMAPTFEYNGRGVDSCMDPSLPIVPGSVYTVLLLERTDAVTVWISPNEGPHSLAFRFR